MSDIDDELLALAGDASSDEEDEAPANAAGKSSASPDRKTMSKSNAKRSGREGDRNEDSEEEGEA